MPDGPPLDLSRLVDRDAAEKAERRATAGGSAGVSAATSRRTSTTSQAMPALNLTPRGNLPSLRTPGTAASTSGAVTPRLAGGAATIVCMHACMHHIRALLAWLAS